MSGFRQCLRLLGLTLFRSRGTSARPTPKRVGMLSLLIPLLLFLQVCHWIGFLLDEVFFRGYRKLRIRAPVFILGLPRSGTTFLHRLLARDTDNYTAMKLWEMLLAPSITERRVLLALAAVDRLLGGYGRRLLGAIDASVFAGGSKIHKISLFEPEEDDLLLLPIFSSIFLLHLFPFPQALWHLIRFDKATLEADKRRIMSFYHRCVQRHLYVHGPNKHFLSKNPAFSTRIESLDEYFPDSKVICCLRDPFRAIPSFLSYMYRTWEWLDNDRRGDYFRDMVLELASHWYRHSIGRLSCWPRSRCAIIQYDALTSDPDTTVRRLYSRLELSLRSVFEEVLEEESINEGAYRSEHRYSLGHFGLTPDDIMTHFGSLVEYLDSRAEVPRTSESLLRPLT